LLAVLGPAIGGLRNYANNIWSQLRSKGKAQHAWLSFERLERESMSYSITSLRRLAQTHTWHLMLDIRRKRGKVN